MAVIGLASALAGCGAEPDQRNSPAVTTDPATVSEALRFGNIVLPPTAKVLGVQYDRGIDGRYRLAISQGAADLDALLAGSKFVARLEPDLGPFMAPVQGFDLTKATAVMSGEDSLPPQGDRKQWVFRRVVIDRSDPLKPVVHLWLFTT